MNILKNKRHAYLAVSILSFSIGLVIAYIGGTVNASPLVLVGFIFMVGGVVIFIRRRGVESADYLGQDKQGEASEGEVSEEGKKEKVIANSLIITPELIYFDHVTSPVGLPQKCLNNNKLYYVLKRDKEGADLVEFKLPDDDENERYYDPSEFANPVTMPSNKKYFTWSISTMQKVSVGIMVVCIVAMLVGVVALS